MWEAPDACEECEPVVLPQRSYCRNCGLTVDAAAAGGAVGPLWHRGAGALGPLPARTA